MRDDFDTVVADRFMVLDDASVPDTWPQIQSKLLNDIPDRVIEKAATTIDLAASEPTIQYHTGRKRVIVASLVAAAAVVAIALVAIRTEEAEAPADQPSPTFTVAPSVAPTTPLTSNPTVAVDSIVALDSTVPPPASTVSDPFGADTELLIGDLEPGAYAYLDVDGQGFNVRFAVPEGWTWNGRYLSKGGIDPPDGAAIFFYGGSVNVYANPCSWFGSGSDPATGSKVTDLLNAQPMRHATSPISRPAPVPSGPADRWPGTVVELTVPADIDFADCDGGQFRSWGPENNARWHQGPGQHDVIWSVDIGGAGIIDDQGNVVVAPPSGGLIIDAASFAGTPVEVGAEIDAILASIAVGHWG